MQHDLRIGDMQRLHLLVGKGLVFQCDADTATVGNGFANRFAAADGEDRLDRHLGCRQGFLEGAPSPLRATPGVRPLAP